MAESSAPRVDATVDGGDTGCGELLLRLVGTLRTHPAGAVIRLVATDPAAPIDLPAWCHLTGHHYLGHGKGSDGRPHYDLEVGEHVADTDDARPWHIRHPSATKGHHPS